MNIVLGVSNPYSWERVISYKYFFGTGLGTSRVNLGTLHLSFLCLRVACFLCDGTYLLLARALETISGPMRLGEHQCASINFFFLQMWLLYVRKEHTNPWFSITSLQRSFCPARLLGCETMPCLFWWQGETGTVKLFSTRSADFGNMFVAFGNP